jgi:short-subunit dehydrogenase
MNYALITGASKGIGKAIAEELAKKGYPVLLVARNEELLKKITTDISSNYKVAAHYLAIDLSVTGAAQKVLDWCNAHNYIVSILVNNAGYGLSGVLDKHPLSHHLNMMQLNMGTLVEFTYLFLPQLKQQPAAYIMNIASNASYQAVPKLNVYAASKAFVLSFSRGLKHELNNTPVSVTAICPGPTDTDFPNRAEVGNKAQNLAKKVNLSPQQVATIAVKAMFAKKAEVITGFINKLGAFMVWLLPKVWVEKSAAGIYD